MDRIPLRPAALVATLLALAAPVAAQGVHYTSTNRMEFAGSMGTLMGAFGAQDPTSSQTWVEAGRMRTDDGTTGTVMNLLDGTYLFIDHESRTYFRSSFADMMAMGRQAADSALASAPQAPAPEAEPESQVQAEYSLDVDRTGERRTISGYQAERVILTLAVEFQAETEEGDMAEAGDMVLVSDLWMSPDFPSSEEMMREALAEGDASWVEDMETQRSEGMAQIMATNPQMGEALERMGEEMEGLDGTALETTSYVVLLAPGMELDRDAVLALNGQPLSEGMGSVAGRAAESAARDAAADAAANAARRAAGRLGGLLGRNRNEAPPEPEVAAPTQTVIARITSVVEAIEPGPFEPSVFEPDPTYTEQRPPWMGGG